MRYHFQPADGSERQCNHDGHGTGTKESKTKIHFRLLFSRCSSLQDLMPLFFLHQHQQKTFIYRRQLLKSEFEAFCVVCDSLCGDVLHSILEHLLVPDVSLDQMVEARRLFHSGVKLKNTCKSFSNILFIQLQHFDLKQQATNAAHSFETLPPGLG